MLNNLRARFFDRTDGATLGLVRALFGAVMVLETLRYIMYARVIGFFVQPTFYFKYWGFEWVTVPQGDAIFLLFGLMGLGAVGLMAGFATRVTAPLFFLSYTYIHLMDAAEYNNHYYLIMLLSFLFWITPCEAAFSMDARRKRRLALAASAPPPHETVPRWSIWIFKFQMAAVYLFAAFAKWTPDWIIHGQPMRRWLYNRADRVPLLTEFLQTDVAGWFFVYSGMLYDLLVVPLLLWRRTRWLAVALSLCFHGMNKLLFDIGIFPLMALSTTIIFFEPDWPRRAGAWLRGLLGNRKPPLLRAAPPTARPPRAAQYAIMVGLAIYAGIQLALPLRHFAYPGNPSWTEEGHRFSWRMKLRDKYGELHYMKVSDPASRRVEEVNIRDYLMPHQEEALFHPFMLGQFAQFIAEEYREKRGWNEPQVRVKIMASLNDRPLQLLVDPWRDLAAVSLAPWPPVDWIIPVGPLVPNAPPIEEQRLPK